MKRFNQVKRFGVVVVSTLVGGSAFAAVDPAVTTAISEAGTDALTVITALTVAAGTLVAGYWMYRAINRAK